MATETNEEKVHRFIDYNRNIISSTLISENCENQGINAKILLCSVIDSLAKSRFPDMHRNGARFIRTIEESASWPDCERISLLHLRRAMEVAPELPPVFAELEERTEQLLRHRLPISNRILSSRIQITNDPHIDEIITIWPCDKAGQMLKLDRISLQDLTHKGLLWQYRNSLVHEYRIPGRSSELGPRRNEPFYQQVSQIEDISSEQGIVFTNRWELLYPTGFFRQLVEQILDEVAKFHLANNTSPFAPYSEGSYWIPRFND